MNRCVNGNKVLGQDPEQFLSLLVWMGLGFVYLSVLWMRYVGTNLSTHMGHALFTDLHMLWLLPFVSWLLWVKVFNRRMNQTWCRSMVAFILLMVLFSVYSSYTWSSMYEHSSFDFLSLPQAFVMTWLTLYPLLWFRYLLHQGKSAHSISWKGTLLALIVYYFSSLTSLEGVSLVLDRGHPTLGEVNWALSWVFLVSIFVGMALYALHRCACFLLQSVSTFMVLIVFTAALFMKCWIVLWLECSFMIIDMSLLYASLLGVCGAVLTMYWAEEEPCLPPKNPL